MWVWAMWVCGCIALNALCSCVGYQGGRGLTRTGARDRSRVVVVFWEG